MSISDFADEIARSIGFLSRIPMPSRFFSGYDGSLSRTVGAFPIAGIVIALPGAVLLAVLLHSATDPLLAALLALAGQTILTGALHEDGFSDSADGLGGGRDRESALAIMKDSRIGTYGAVALILSFGIRASAISAVAFMIGPLGTLLVMIGAAALSRALLVWHWSLLGPARTDGVAASVGAPEAASTRLALVTGGLIFVVLAGNATSFVTGVLSAAVAALAVWGFTGYVERRLGGHTGDTIGAAQQIAEISALVALAVLFDGSNILS